MITSIAATSAETDRTRSLRHILADVRAGIGWQVSRLGQAICRLGHRIDESAFNGSESEAWQAGFGIAETYYRRPTTTREDAVRILTRLGLDSSDDALAKLGYGDE